MESNNESLQVATLSNTNTSKTLTFQNGDIITNITVSSIKVTATDDTGHQVPAHATATVRSTDTIPFEMNRNKRVTIDIQLDI